MARGADSREESYQILRRLRKRWIMNNIFKGVSS